MKTATKTVLTDWSNIDLSSPCESSLNMLDAYSFDTLLLEVECNLREINKATVKAQAMESINAKYNEALSILNDNLANITKEALKYRNSK
jgi:hypothetical protein